MRTKHSFINQQKIRLSRLGASSIVVSLSFDKRLGKQTRAIRTLRSNMDVFFVLWRAVKTTNCSTGPPWVGNAQPSITVVCLWDLFGCGGVLFLNLDTLCPQLVIYWTMTESRNQVSLLNWESPPWKSVISILSCSSFYSCRPPHSCLLPPSLLLHNSFLTHLSCSSSLPLSLPILSLCSPPSLFFPSLLSLLFRLLFHPAPLSPSSLTFLSPPALPGSLPPLSFPFLLHPPPPFTPSHVFPSLSFHPSTHLYISLSIHLEPKLLFR